MERSGLLAQVIEKSILNEKDYFYKIEKGEDSIILNRVAASL